MSTTGKAVLWVVVIAVIVGVIWWWMASRGSGTGAALTSNNMNSPAAAGTQAGTAGTASSSLPQGDSDQAISQEMTNINAQMNGLSSDTTNVNQSMSDQPVQQAE